MKKLLLSILFLVIACGSPAIAVDLPEPVVEPAAPSMKEMSFDDFLHGILSVTIPIKISIPTGYDHADMPGASPFSSLWMTSSGAEKTQRTGDFPIESGWMQANLSSGVTFDKSAKQFVGIDQYRQEAARNGFQVLNTNSVSVNGYPIVFMEVFHKPTNKPIYVLYVATLLEGNVVVISYRPPQNSRSVGDAVWAALKKSVSAE